MSQKKLSLLLISALVLGLLYYLLVPAINPSTQTAERRLFEGIDGQKIAKVLIEQGEEKVELELKNNQWQVPARSGYAADASKIRALLLKIVDLSVSQRIPGDGKSFEKLGVDDEALKRGKGRVSMLDADGKLIAGINLGDSRKSRDSGPMGQLSGQFVRRVGEDAVYLLGSPVTLSLGASNWLDVNLVNVLPNAVQAIAQSKSTDSGSEVLFELERTGAFDTAGLPLFSIKGGVPEGKVLQETVVSQIRSGLENLRITDVLPSGSSELKDVKFDNSTVVQTNNGLVYKLSSAQKGEKYYATVSVSYDQELAATLKKQAEDQAAKDAAAKEAAKQQAAQAASSATPDGAASSTQSSSSSSDSSVADTKAPELKLSNAEEAAKLNEQFSKWVYEIPSYSMKKFRYTKAELVEPPAPPKTTPEGGGFPAGAPAETLPGAE